MNENKNILIIGMSQMGKTHFGGQLYGQLVSRDYAYELRETPNDLSLFKEILEELNNGRSGKHTSTKLHETVILPIETKDKSKQIDIIYPDYGGEQIRNMIEERQIPQKWQEQIKSSNHWYLFIRLNMIEKIADITTKFYSQVEAEEKATNEEKEAKSLVDLPENSAAYYVELLQIFLYIKNAKKKPQLIILLSLWDKIEFKDEESREPMKALQKVMPLFFSYINNNWEKDNYRILGLSSLGRDLDAKKVDCEVALKGPENFCYYILPNGEKEKDITKILDYIKL